MTLQGKSLVRRSVDYVWTPDAGYSFVPSDVGTKQAVGAQSKAYRSLRIPHRVRHDGPVYEITAEHQLPDDGSAEVPYGSWALVGQQESVDWRQHPAFLALNEAEQWIINRVLAREVTDEPSDFSWEDGTGTTFTPSADAEFFYVIAFNGQNYYTRTNYTLRHNLTVSQVYEARLSGGNINCVFTTSQLLAECANFNDPLPPLLIAEIDAIPALAAQTGYIYGWLKQTPSIQTVAGGRVECSVEYVREVWPTLFYPAAT